MTDEATTRKYLKRKRAIREDATRLRITEVLVELHGTVGPANTTVTEVAERAGVSRMTVYNHFPTETALFEACSSHWLAQNPPPDPAAWAAISDPEARLRPGLGELYRWYRSSQDMLGNVLRDADLVPAVGEVLDARWWPYLERFVDVFEGAPSPGPEATDRRAAIRLVVDFRTWQALAGSGLDDERAAALAARMVTCAVG
jgi:AcrR family transcriptional regulator